MIKWDLWIYFGLRIENERTGGMAHYVLEYDITFRDGETCGGSEEEKIRISYSKGKYVDGKSFKLAY